MYLASYEINLSHTCIWLPKWPSEVLNTMILLDTVNNYLSCCSKSVKQLPDSASNYGLSVNSIAHDKAQINQTWYQFDDISSNNLLTNNLSRIGHGSNVVKNSQTQQLVAVVNYMVTVHKGTMLRQASGH